MNIAIDARTLVHARSGVGTYAERIIRSFLRIDPVNRYYVFLVKPYDSLEAPNLTKILIDGYDRMILNRYWENIILPDVAHELDIDVYFSPAYALPMLPRFRPIARFLPMPHRLKRWFNIDRRPRYVVAVHDVISSVLPETFTPRMRMWQYLFNSNSARVADVVLASSASTQRDYARHFGKPAKDIPVIHLSIDERFHPNTDASTLEAVRQKYGLPGAFILDVGTLEPRKNVTGLARAYAALPEGLRRQYPLVLSGSVGWYGDAILKELEGLQLGTSLRLLGFTDHEDLPALYTLASLFVYPSLYEGFGFPPLEAMACGTPVITSNNSSLPEVVGDAGIMIDPHDDTALTSAMRTMLEQPELMELYRAKGLERAGMFGWEDAARRTLDVLEAVVRPS